MINTVIFDLDGLLIDTEIISYQVYSDLLAQYGFSLSIDAYARSYSGKSEIANMKNLIAVYQLPIGLEEGMALEAAREKEYFKKGIAMKSGAKKLLAFLKENNYRLILASSSTRERAVGVLEQNGVLHYFDHMVFGPEIKNGKPHPEIFLTACRKAKESPLHCLVLEDSEAGIQAAHSAGIRVICVPDIKLPGEAFIAMTTAVMPSLSDVIPFIKTL